MLLSNTIPKIPATPPKGFKAAKSVSNVRFCPTPSFAQAAPKLSGAKRRGLLYEDRVTGYLDRIDVVEWTGLPKPWLSFETKRGEQRFAQPDWLGINPRKGLIVIAEVKLSRVAKAWWQLNELYKPLVEVLFPNWDIALLEIAAMVQPVRVPEEIRVIHDFSRVVPGRTSFMKLDYNVK